MTKSPTNLLQHGLMSLPLGAQRRILGKLAWQRFRENPLKWCIHHQAARQRQWLPTQIEAFNRWRKVKLFGKIGGNRSGKTVWGAAVVVGEALGHDPLTWPEMQTRLPELELGPPKLIWCVTTTFDKSRMNQQKAVWQQTPECLRRTTSRWRPTTGFFNAVLEFKNGSIVKFKSAEQDLVEFESESVDLVWIDEAVPLAIIRACLARLIDRSGRIILTDIPSRAELHDLFVDRRFDPSSTEMLATEDVDLLSVKMTDNYFLPEREIIQARRMWGTKEAAMRVEGQWVVKEGVVYTDWRDELHLESTPIPLPRHWSRYEVIDPGWANPCAVLFAAVDDRGCIHVYDEIYERRRTPVEIAALIFIRRWKHAQLIDPTAFDELRRLLTRPPQENIIDLREREQNLARSLEHFLTIHGHCQPQITLIDPSAKAIRQGQSESTQALFAQAGIWSQLANNDREAGILRVSQYLRGIDGEPLLKVGLQCAWFRHEINHYRYAAADPKNADQYLGDREKIRDFDDHLMDGIRYLCLYRPTWTPLSPPEPPRNSIAGRHKEIQRAKAIANQRGARQPRFPVPL